MEVELTNINEFEDSEIINDILPFVKKYQHAYIELMESLISGSSVKTSD